MVSIGEAGNTWYPSLYVILNKGYEVVRTEPSEDSGSGNLFVAKKQGNSFIASDSLSLLGLISIWESLGDDLLDKVAESERLALEVIKYEDPEDDYDDDD
jgi:hypothetical protein